MDNLGLSLGAFVHPVQGINIRELLVEVWHFVCLRGPGPGQASGFNYSLKSISSGVTGDWQGWPTITTRIIWTFGPDQKKRCIHFTSHATYTSACANSSKRMLAWQPMQTLKPQSSGSKMFNGVNIYILTLRAQNTRTYLVYCWSHDPQLDYGFFELWLVGVTFF